MIIAHRGASEEAPENTVAAVKRAWELGADAVEVDVHLTADGQVVLIHDKDTKRTTGEAQTLIIKETPAATLRELDVGSWKAPQFAGEKIPFISEILDILPPGKTLFIEIKSGKEILPALKAAIEKSGKLNQIVFTAFSWKTIQAVRKTFPNNPCYWVISKDEGLDEKLKQASEAGLTGVALRYKIINESTMALANEHKLDVIAWTVNNPKTAKKLTKLGVKSIITDQSSTLKTALEK